MDKVSLAVRVTPRADRDAVIGWQSELKDELIVRVCAAPDDGKANASVIKTLAKSLGIPKSSISIIRGYTSRHKLLSLEMDTQNYENWQQNLPVRP